MHAQLTYITGQRINNNFSLDDIYTHIIPCVDTIFHKLTNDIDFICDICHILSTLKNLKYNLNIDTFQYYFEEHYLFETNINW